MNIVNHLTMHSYAFVKRNPKVKAWIVPVYKFFADFIIKLRSLGRGTKQHVSLQRCSSLESWIQTSTAQGNWFKRIHPAQQVQRSLPKTTESVHWKFKTHLTEILPDTFVASIKSARIFDDGKVITPDNQVISEVSKEIVTGEYHALSSFNDSINFPLKKLKGKIAVLSAPSGTGYYHWMFDVLPRLHLIEASGVDLSTIDYFLINDYVARFHIESLDFLEIPKSKIITSQWNPYLQAEEVIIPSLTGNTGHISKWACDFLRKKFLSQRIMKDKLPLKLYLSRGQVAHRRVIDEQKLIETLGGVGFVSVVLESLSLSEQVRLLNNASIVIAPHGAGLTNIVFCEPGAKVIEILSPTAVNLMYWTLCNQMGLDYYYLLADGIRPADYEDLYDNSADLRVDINALMDLLKSADIDS